MIFCVRSMFGDSCLSERRHLPENISFVVGGLERLWFFPVPADSPRFLGQEGKSPKKYADLEINQLIFKHFGGNI